MWILAGFLLCGAAHSFDEADLTSVARAVEESTQALLSVAGRDLLGFEEHPKVKHVACMC